MEKKVKIKDLKASPDLDDLAYWLSRSEEDRISAVEILRRQQHGNTARLQSSVAVVQRKRS